MEKQQSQDWNAPKATLFRWPDRDEFSLLFLEFRVVPDQLIRSQIAEWTACKFLGNPVGALLCFGILLE